MSGLSLPGLASPELSSSSDSSRGAARVIASSEFFFAGGCPAGVPFARRFFGELFFARPRRTAGISREVPAGVSSMSSLGTNSDLSSFKTLK